MPVHEADRVEAADGAVVRRVLGGDVEAYRILVERYRRQFGRYAVSLLGDADLAADAVQEAFIRAFDSLGSCREPDRFGAWFYRILTNQCHTVRTRSGARRDTVPVEDAGLTSRERADAGLEQGELAARLEAALDQLTPEQREAFVLKYVDERSYEEMAALLDVSADALKMRVHRAREALRAIMGAAR
ncbi:MAG: hypothetical protein A2085_07295 [Gemmatimonadetes bacterium GWC2_71_10]|nr:MAG: hypothetical protein A2085_07295 [Gemmatimonadetes bacterium GWC2_71_10]